MSHLVGVWVQMTSRPLVIGVLADTGAVGALPAQTRFLQWGGFGLRADEVGVTGAVGLAEGVATDDQGRGLDVVHRHPAEGLTDVDGRGERIRIAVRALRD